MAGRRYSIVLVFLLFATAWFSGCLGAGAHAPDFVYGEPTTIAAALPIIAGEKGFWLEQGLDVQVERFSAGRLALDATLSGNAQANSVSETGPMLAILKGQPIFIVATAGRHQETKFIGRKDKGILEPKDLAGKKIASLPGTNSDYFTDVFLQAHGLGRKDLGQLLNLAPPDAVTALINGDIDGFFAWEPHIYYAQSKLGANAIVFGPGDLYAGYHTVIMRQDFVKSNPAKVEKFLRGLKEAEEFAKNNPDASMQLVAKHLGMEERAVRSLWKEYDFSLGLDSGLLATLDKESKWAVSSHIATPVAPVDFRDYVFAEPLRKLLPEAVSIQ